MNVLLFLIMVVISFIAVRAGAIAFQLTGLEWSLAKFQALSCFSGTGFTTKEAELITGNPQRRRIASVLIVFGNAGLVTLIATFANTLKPSVHLPKINIPFLHLVVPSRILPWINLLIVIIILFVFYRIVTHTKVTQKLTTMLRHCIIKKDIVKAVSFEELLVSTGGYGVSSLEVTKNNPALNKTLAETNLRERDITVLAIERENDVIPNPQSNAKILQGDRLICFGKLDRIRNEMNLIT